MKHVYGSRNDITDVVTEQNSRENIILAYPEQDRNM